ncbi:hypothetical protein JCM11251_007035 [Rhodosporidiobolus azoricus]
MRPARRAVPAAPLLSFPPSPPRPTPLPSRADEKPRSTVYKCIAFLPLVFIFALLGFAAYAFVWSLCIDYLLLHQHRYLRATLYLCPGLFLLFGCAGNVWMAYWRGGGIVPGAGQWKKRDEEAALERDGAGREEVERFVLGLEEEERGEEEGGAGGGEREEEEEGLLQREAGREGASSRRDYGGRRPQTLQVKSDGTQRFCRKCNTFKPDRAHHCSSCRRCVLKMDHHCPWLGGGCVGFANYKFFLLFLLYTGALGVFLGAVLFRELMEFVDDVENGFELAPLSWALAALLGVIFGAAVGLFGMYHLYLASRNRTTIEAMEQPTTISPLAPFPPPATTSSSSSSSHPLPPPNIRTPLQLTSKQRHRLARAARKYNIYDRGWRENLWAVFGSAGSSSGSSSELEGDGEGEGLGKGRRARGRAARKWWRKIGTAVECVMPWGWPPGDGHSFPLNHAHLASLRQVTEEIYAEAAAAAAAAAGQ